MLGKMQYKQCSWLSKLQTAPIGCILNNKPWNNKKSSRTNLGEIWMEEKTNFLENTSETVAEKYQTFCPGAPCAELLGNVAVML